MRQLRVIRDKRAFSAAEVAREEYVFCGPSPGMFLLIPCLSLMTSQISYGSLLISRFRTCLLGYWFVSIVQSWNNNHTSCHWLTCYRPYAYDVTEGRPAALGVKRNTATCVIAKHAARGANPASHTTRLACPGPRTERLSANAHCQHNTCALRDTRLASLLWRCEPLWRQCQCIRSIVQNCDRNQQWVNKEYCSLSVCKDALRKSLVWEKSPQLIP